MPQKVLSQIQYLCREIPKVEWSGILFYKVEGSIKDPSTMKLILEDILPMHKGTSAYTEYTFDERVVEHMMDNEYLEDYKIGHIHSHNTMSVFFSGTDWSELEDNAPNHNFYLSLIVNNFMDFMAKVCFIAKPFSLSAKDEEGAAYSFVSESLNTDQKLIVYDCEIVSPNIDIKVEEEFSKKVTDIIEKAQKTLQLEPAESFYKKHSNMTKFDWGIQKTNSIPNEDWEDKRWQIKEEIQEEIEDVLENAIEDFSRYILDIEGSSRVFHNITDVIKYHKSKRIDGKTLAKAVLTHYYRFYSNYWEQTTGMETEEMFTRVTEQVIDNLENERDSSTLPYMDDMLNPTIDGLRSLLRHFKK